MALSPPFNISEWLKENAYLLQPPVNNYCVYHPSNTATTGYTVMILGGPNNRTDYHINPTPEFFYQYRGSMILKVVNPSGEFQDISILEGSLFLLPANVPHCPVRFKDTVGIVMEQPRLEGVEDEMRWYCSSCGKLVWQKRFICTDLGSQIKKVIQEFDGDLDKKRCGACGAIASIKFKEGEIIQP